MVEAAANRVVVYDVPVFDAKADGSETLSGEYAEGGTNPLHLGTCVDGTLALKVVGEARLPDGTPVRFSKPEMPNKETYIEFDIEGRTMTIWFDKDQCVNISKDGKRILTVTIRGGQIEIYDLEKIRMQGGAGKAVVDRIFGTFVSAFFVGPNHDVVTADGDHKVLLWRKKPSGRWGKEEIFQGERPVFYAEPDQVGEKLIIIENMGSNFLRGSLYSVSARKRWVGVGQDHWDFVATFTENGDIATGTISTAVVYKLPTLAELAKTAVDRLHPTCRPSAAGGYRESACWPAWLRGSP